MTGEPLTASGDENVADDVFRSLVCRTCGFRLVGPVEAVRLDEMCDNLCGPMAEDE